MRKLWNFLNSPLFDFISGLFLVCVIAFTIDPDALDYTSCAFMLLSIIAADCLSNALCCFFVRIRRGRGGKP